MSFAIRNRKARPSHFVTSEEGTFEKFGVEGGGGGVIECKQANFRDSYIFTRCSSFMIFAQCTHEWQYSPRPKHISIENDQKLQLLHAIEKIEKYVKWRLAGTLPLCQTSI